MSINNRKKLFNILRKNSISSEEHFIALNLLEQYKNNNYFYLFNMGKLYYKQNKYLEAKELFEAASLIKDNARVNYYLFKVNIRLKEYEDAYSDLFKYRELRNYDVDINLPLTMLEILIDIKRKKEVFNNDYSIPITDTYNRITFIQRKIKSIYHTLINNFNNKNYELVSDDINKFSNILKSNGYNINLEDIKILNNSIIEEKSIYYFKKLKEDNNIQLTKKEFIEGLLYGLNNNRFTNYELLILINNLVKIDYKKAKEILDNIRNRFDKEDEIYILNNIENKIDERIELDKLNNNDKEYINRNKKEANKYLVNLEYDYAHYTYLELFNKFKLNIFNYYLGKIYALEKDYDNAIKHLEEYILNGGEKNSRALLLLLTIYEDTNNKEKIEETIKKLSYHYKYFNSDKKLINNYETYIGRKKKNYKIFTN